MEALDRLRSRQTEIRSRLEEIDAEAQDGRFSDEQRSEWNDLNAELDANGETIAELEARKARLGELTGDGRIEAEPKPRFRGKTSRVPEDPTDLMAYRQVAGNIEELHDGYLEGALRIVDGMAPADARADREATQAHVDHLLRHTDDGESRDFARRVIATSSPTYARAFGKYLKGDHRTPEEERALSLTSGSGGYAVPVTLDPTVILTGAGYANPVRNLAKVITITGNTWQGVSSTGITAGYGAEATEASDNAPTLVQPSANVEKAFAFVPYSIEIGGDWSSLGAEMAELFADAKNKLENTKFLTGLGHGSNEPQGLIAVGGATAVVSSATTAVFAVADLYSLESALDPRWRDRASIVGNRAAFQKVRQFDTAGGANLWVQLQYGAPATLLGYPAHEWSAYSSAMTTSGSTILTMGDFSKFQIVDRVGMDVEVIPHLFATANNRPSGQRGLYCYWRNTSTVLTPGLAANSAFISLKLL